MVMESDFSASLLQLQVMRLPLPVHSCIVSALPHYSQLFVVLNYYIFQRLIPVYSPARPLLQYDMHHW